VKDTRRWRGPGPPHGPRALLLHKPARRDEAGIEPDFGRQRHDLLKIAPQRGLAAREMQLQDAERGGLLENVEPNLGWKLAASALQHQRVGAVRALQWAAMRELGQQPERGPDGRRLLSARCNKAHAVTTPLSTRSCSMGRISQSMRSLGAL